MTNPKETVIASVAEAKDHLELALAHLERLPAFDPQVLGFTAHALGNYLTVVDGTLELLQHALRDHPDEQVGSWLEGLRHASSLMTQTASQLLRSSARSDLKLVRTRTELSRLVERACAYYGRVAGRKQIRITCESSAAAPDVWTDRVAVAAVLDNLLSNAVKYSKPGKQVWVRVDAEPAHLVCSVRDEGPGLSTQDRARLFQRGVRLSAAPTGGEPSTGYGLAVAKELVEKLGGEIWCESEPGHGACFHFRLPACREDAPALRGGPHVTSQTPV